jgi:probable F420-dependent oxidoreductase
MRRMRPFRFGVQCSRMPTVEQWRDLARRCEDSGYACLYIPDHFEDQFGPLVALTIAAEATTALRVGSLVFDNDYRHPVVLAKEIATLQLASSGRVEFGLGAGWMTTDYEESGIPLDAPGVRVERMVEGLAVMKGLWANERFSFTGRHYAVTEAHGLPRPGSMPSIVIGGGSKRILSIAAREADVVGINVDLRFGHVGREVLEKIGPASWDERVRWVREAAGDRWDEIDLQALTFVVNIGRPHADVAAEMAPLFGVSAEEAVDIPLVMVGTVEEICDQLLERRKRWGFNYIVVHEGEMDAFAPVVERLAGT